MFLVFMQTTMHGDFMHNIRYYIKQLHIVCNMVQWTVLCCRPLMWKDM